ncbi:nuclear transport factor 2 family protein [Nocardia sp. NBC_00565]|nr:hypothetical protein [Nocardia sp. NBC_00565]WUC03430.1 nuclear transport factor 2 family protein [Nocardia sp. NBC_00565]
MDPDTLQAINAIESLKARYFRSLDTKNWSTFSSAQLSPMTSTWT